MRFFNKAKTSSKVSNYTFLTNDIVNNSLVSVRYDEGGVYPATKQSFYNMLTYVGSTLKIGS